MSRVCCRFLISGKVQGVWFRESTRRQGIGLSLVGTAVNLPDGRVEVVVAGNEPEIEQLAAWLQHGPLLARVDQVLADRAEDTGFSDFTTG